MFKKTITVVACIVLAEVAGIIGSLFTTPAIPGWYATLTKPTLTPPNWVFGPVWTILFALMGIALYLVLSKRTTTQKTLWRMGVIFFGIQLVLNIGWSLLFFRLQNPLLAFIELIALWLAILATTIIFYKTSKPAGWLLLPYLLWVAFAGYLNISIWHLNNATPPCTQNCAPYTTTWEQATDTTTQTIFYYPTELTTQYIHTVDWPPQLQIIEGPFTCTNAGNIINRAGKTENRTINNHTYCVTEVQEGAAGSVYTQYAYLFQKDGQILGMTFTTRQVQCYNYDDPQQTACLQEQNSFSMDPIADEIAQSVQF